MGTTWHPADRGIITVLVILAIPALLGILAPAALIALPSAAGESASQLAETGASGLLPIIVIAAILIIAGVALALFRARSARKKGESANGG
ncbi:hypothetical protein D9V32_12720 [Mycetocola tolaasinivorans]|uniref:LPXTG cell wall anchor domain-containing protein n=1 Tax=Mycetocola tolaasinivorans TaxID=76635 RepID=A0A3L7A2M0_9MICO|nr:hypothetical protein [Mycetocola tolaasinivorans]RLP74546.1 hypothetical protein D9V32_12720 [Mycetocola tolaasinivorans]